MNDSISKRSRADAMKLANILREKYISPEAQRTARDAMNRFEANGYRLPSPREMLAQRAQAAIGLGAGGVRSGSNSGHDDQKRAREILDILRDHYLEPKG
ncbi:MAG: hypothetical protein QM523_03155 [Candidatus Pacebacteria bacterium]|nr:hypothetical protein [Candidatus Paceibacterota bacterium]